MNMGKFEELKRLVASIEASGNGFCRRLEAHGARMERDYSRMSAMIRQAGGNYGKMDATLKQLI